jgi:hypothetical protein
MMFSQKRTLLFAALFSLMTVAAPLISTAAEVSVREERWLDKPAGSVGWVVWADDFNSEFSMNQAPYLAAGGTDGHGGGDGISFESIAPCPDMYSGACRTAQKMEYYPFLKACMEATDIDCIEKVWIEINQKVIAGRFNTYFPEDVKYAIDHIDRGSVKFDGSSKKDGDPSIPDGVGGSIWKFDGLDSETSASYYVSARLLGHLTRKDGQLSRTDDWAKVSIDRISTTSTPNRSPHVNFDIHNGRYAWGGAGLSVTNEGSCLAADGKTCLLRERTPEGTRMAISLRLANPLNSWLHGRFANPDFTSEKVPKGYLVTLKADYVRVPYIQENLSAETMAKVCAPEQLKQLRLAPGNCNFNAMEDSQKFDEFALISPLLSQKADAYVSSWRFVTKPSWSIGNSPCAKPTDRLTGIVSTNATLYDSSAPQFNKSEGTLNYRLGALHYTPSGDVFKGSYNLSLDSTYAKCLWSLSNIPLSASISITGESGSVATTTMRVSNNYVDFHADAFTFSTPTISIKLEDSKPEVKPSATPSPAATAAPTQTPKPASSPASISGILKCAKGSKVVKYSLKTVKKCPAGYKKVS